MSADKIRSLQRWLIRIHDEATAMMDLTDYPHSASFSKLRQMALEGLDHPNAERLDRIREGKTNE